MNKQARGALALGVVVAMAGVVSQASSHREAPGITKSPKVDGTDFYMFRSFEPGREGFVTMLANYYPLQDPAGGPNFFMLDTGAVYEIHVDNNGDAREDLTFQFRPAERRKDLTVRVGDRDVAVPLINIGPIGPSRTDTENLNVIESYTLNVIRGPRRSGNLRRVTPTGGGDANFLKPVDRIGDKSIRDNDPTVYERYANEHIYQVNIPGCAVAGSRVFVGQRREGFVINVGEALDLVNLNPLGPIDGERNDLAGKNVTTLAVEIPVSCLTRAGQPIIGAWTTASYAPGGGNPSDRGGDPSDKPDANGDGDDSADCEPGKPGGRRPAADFVPSKGCEGWVPSNHPLAKKPRTAEVSSVDTNMSSVDTNTEADSEDEECPPGKPRAPYPGAGFVASQGCDGWVPANHPAARKGPGESQGGPERGGFVQVSRLANPLVNELVIGLKDKDRFNRSEPRNDSQFLEYVTHPTFPALIEILFGVPDPPAPRADLVRVFLTGVPGLNMPAGVQPSEVMRLNTSIAPKAPAMQNPLGVIGGDTAGYPNGRRPGDDVVDITLRVAEGILLSANPATFPAFTDGAVINASIGYNPDGTVNPAVPLFRRTFPYLQTPLSPSPNPVHLQ